MLCILRHERPPSEHEGTTVDILGAQWKKPISLFFDKMKSSHINMGVLGHPSTFQTDR